MTRTFLIVLLLNLFTLEHARSHAFQVKHSGQGQPILFLPGFTCPGDLWDATISNLNADYSTYQFTYAGFGGVPAIDLPWYATLVNDLTEYIQTKELNDVTIVGHSMGGMLAISIAARLPKQVTRLVLVDALPNIREIVMPHIPVEQISFDSPYNQQMMAASDSAIAATAGFMAMGMSYNTQKHQELVANILNADRKTYVYGYTELLLLDLRDQLSQIKAQTLILGAGFPSQERVLPNFKAQYADMPNKEIKIAQDSKHFIMYDQPEWFYQEVNNFLN